MTRTPSAAVFASTLCLLATAAHAELSYRIAAINDPANPTQQLLPNDLNNKGELVGFVEAAGTSAFHWRNGTFTNLGPVIDPASQATEAVAINDRSVILGHRNDRTPRAFSLKNNRRTDIVISQGGATDFLFASNNRNQIVGRSQNRPFLRDHGRVSFLEELPGTDPQAGSTPWEINDRGVAVGTSGPIGDNQAVIWTDGAVMPLNLLPGVLRSEGKDINDFGHVIGNAVTSSSTFGFLWAQGTTTALPTVNSAQVGSFAAAINNWGAVVGFTGSGDNALATLWLNGQAIDINTLIAANDPLREHVKLENARFINDRGQIVALGRRDEGPVLELFMLTPTRRPQND